MTFAGAARNCPSAWCGMLPRSISVIDDTSAVAGLGLSFRRGRPGPEDELVNWFLQERPFTIRRGYKVSVLCQPQLETGFPDIVLVVWHPPTAERWDSRRAVLTRYDIRLLHYLHYAGPATTQELRTIFGSKLHAGLDRLTSARTIQKRRETWVARSLSASFAVRRIIAIEAKISNWSVALDQALLNTWFASDSYVLLPRIPRGASLLDEAAGLGIRVLTKAEPDPMAKLSARADLPRSYASWLFNEWVWREHTGTRALR